MKFKLISLFLFVLPLQVVSGQEILSAEKAIELALESNYGIKIAKKNLEIAESNKSIFNTGFLPTVTGSAGTTYNLDNTEAEFSNGETTSLRGAESSRLNASLAVNYTLFDGLGRKYNYQRLKDQYQLTELQARETIENTIIQLFTIYYNVAQLDENVQTLDNTLQISNNRLIRAKYQFDYGQNTKLEVLNAEVDINADSINLLNAKQQLKVAKRDLNLVLGNKLVGDFAVDKEIEFMSILARETLLENAKERNNALLQSEKNIEIGKLDIKSANAAYLPTLGLNGSYGWNKNNNNAASFVAVSTNTGLSAGLNLSWNIFDGGATKIRSENARINLENQRLQKEQLLLQIERDFNNAWDDFQNKLNIYQIQQNNIVTAENNFKRTNEKLKIGQANSIEFRQAQLNLLNAKISVSNAKYDAKLAEFQLLFLSGDLLNVDF